MGQTFEDRVSAVRQLQEKVCAALLGWLKQPSRESRMRLEASLVDVDDCIDRFLCPRSLSVVNLSRNVDTPHRAKPGRPRKVVETDGDAA